MKAPHQGHGHVVPRTDGVKARCGGPALCSTCQREQATTAEDAQGVAAVRAPVAVATSDAERAALPPAFAKLADAKTLVKVLKMNIVSGVLAPLAAELLQSLEEMVLATESLPIDFKQATDQGGWQLVPEKHEANVDLPALSDMYLPQEITWNEHQAAVEAIKDLRAAPTLLGVAPVNAATAVHPTVQTMLDDMNGEIEG